MAYARAFRAGRMPYALTSRTEQVLATAIPLAPQCPWFTRRPQSPAGAIIAPARGCRSGGFACAGQRRRVGVDEQRGHVGRGDAGQAARLPDRERTEARQLLARLVPQAAHGGVV